MAAAAAAAVSAKAVGADAIFRIYMACPNDPKVLLLDVRNLKQFKRGHALHAFCVRMSADGRALLDYSQASYDTPWSQDCWWGRPVVVYGPAGLSKDHPVISFLSKEGRCTSLGYYKDGFEAFEKAYAFLVTASVKQGCIKHFPSAIIPGQLYLGDWADAAAADRLKEIRVKRIVTIHNHPENLKVAPGVKHLKLELPDVAGADISAHFNPTFEFLEEGRRLGEAALVHCGAGVSRSAALVIMYLMRSRPGTTAQQAHDAAKAARSLVQPNDGFWRTLCALEEGLGIPVHERSDPSAHSDFAGADAPPVELAKDAAGEKVAVLLLDASGRPQGAPAGAQPAAADAGAARRDEPRRRSRSRSRDRGRRDERGRSRSRSRERERDHDRRRRGSRSRSRSRGRERDRDRRPSSRSRGRRDAAHAPAAPAAPAPPADAVAAAAAAAAAAGKRGYILALAVSKPDGPVGQLLLGPLGPSQRVVFGRAPAPACDVTLEHLSVSRQHAALAVGPGGDVTVTDLGSAHGTKLGEVWVKPHAARALPVGGSMRFGASTRAYKLERVEKVG